MPEQNQQFSSATSPQVSSSRATSGYGHKIRFCATPSRPFKTTGECSGVVPFSTQARSWAKRPVGGPLGPPKQWASPGTL